VLVELLARGRAAGTRGTSPGRLGRGGSWVTGAGNGAAGAASS
jgi:hypothetical protein